jgi:MFS transporter, SET family, sugar efflux transporter
VRSAPTRSRPAAGAGSADPPGGLSGGGVTVPGMRRGPRGRAAPFLAVLVAIGFADAITGSYFVLFAADELRLDPVRIGVATTLLTLSGIAVGAVAGRWVDRSPSRLPLAAGLLVAAAGFALLPEVVGFVPLLLVCALTGAINLGFPQVFALEHLSRPPGAPGATAVLRSGWSVAWALGPVLAGGLVLAVGYGALFWIAAAGVRGLPRPAPTGAREAAEERPPRRTAAVLPVAAVVLFHTAMFIGSFVLPLQITRDLDASGGWVGVVFGVCAAVEVAVALVLSALGERLPPSVGLIGAAAAFVLYFAGMWAAPALGWVLALQLLRGIGIAAMGVLGIELLQRLLAPQVAAATALFANALAVGALVSGVAAGVLVQVVQVRGALAVCAALAALATACLVVSAVRGRAAVAVESGAAARSR